MKKLLALVMVLWFFSSADAAFQLDTDSISGFIGETLTITVVSSNNSIIPVALWVGLCTEAADVISDHSYDASTDDIVWLTGIPGDAAGTSAQVSMAAWGEQWNALHWPTPPYPNSWGDGTWTSYTFKALEPGTYYVLLQTCSGDSGTTIDYTIVDSTQLNFFAVPEPIAIWLLGLGGLIVRKWRKR